MRFSLAQMTRRAINPRRSKITLRPIEPTAAMASDLYAAAYKPVILFWQHAAERIGAAYERALPVRDSANGGGNIQILYADAIFDLDSILAAIEGELQQLVLAITPRLREWAVRSQSVHQRKWGAAVLAGAGVDISTLLGGSDVSDTVGAFISRNVSLIRSVSDDTRTKISDIVLRNYQSRAPLQQVSKEMAEAVGFSRKRSLRIAAHQSANLYGRLDQARQQQAGITRFKYAHGRPMHPRSWHSARNGKVYNWDTFEEVDGPDVIAPGDRPSEPPGCTCRTQAWIDLS